MPLEKLLLIKLYFLYTFSEFKILVTSVKTSFREQIPSCIGKTQLVGCNWCLASHLKVTYTSKTTIVALSSLRVNKYFEMPWMQMESLILLSNIMVVLKVIGSGWNQLRNIPLVNIHDDRKKLIAYQSSRGAVSELSNLRVNKYFEMPWMQMESLILLSNSMVVLKVIGSGWNQLRNMPL